MCRVIKYLSTFQALCHWTGRDWSFLVEYDDRGASVNHSYDHIDDIQECKMLLKVVLLQQSMQRSLLRLRSYFQAKDEQIRLLGQLFCQSLDSNKQIPKSQSTTRTTKRLVSAWQDLIE
jgi:hypothetical protein